MADEDKKKGAGDAKAKASKGGAEGGDTKKGSRKGGGVAQLAKPVTATPQDRVTPRLRTRYEQDVVPALTRQFGYKSRMEVPRIVKITVNMGLGEAVANGKVIESGVMEVTAITGQKPVITKARKSIASFKLRQGAPIGVMVTLRKERMWEFLDRLTTFALARVRDFKGVSPKAFDGAGNYTLGLKEQIIFPEIDYDKVDKIKGLNISIVTTARNDEEGRALLQQLGMPFRQ
jgi:large subunit ribosomal protein L5